MSGTDSSAKGNASAQVHAGTTIEPTPGKFKNELTKEELALHLEYNENIIALQEKISTVADDENNPDAQSFAAIWEAEIDQELEKVQIEYRALATALDEGRNEFVEAVPIANAAQQTWAGNEFEGSDLRSTEEVYASRTVEVYERTWAQYKMIESGFAHHTRMEYAKFGAELIAIEVMTAGVGKVFSALKYSTRLASALRRMTYSEQMATRFSKLSAKAKEAGQRALDRVFRRRKIDPQDGNTAKTSTASKITNACVKCK